MDEQARLARLATLLFEAARRGDVALLSEAMAGGAPPDLTNQSGDTLVMLAAYYGHAEAVRVLLAAGAQPDRLNDRGQTPLGGAVFKGYTEVVEALLEGGADPLAGSPAPVVVATMFDRQDLLARFDTVLASRRGPAAGEPAPEG